jgi:hypothetical protein
MEAAEEREAVTDVASEPARIRSDASLGPVASGIRGKALAMQRTAGNRATTRWARSLGRQLQRAPTVVRDDIGKRMDSDDWSGAAWTLGQMADAEMRARITAMTKRERVNIIEGARFHEPDPWVDAIVTAMMDIDKRQALVGSLKWARWGHQWARARSWFTALSRDDGRAVAAELGYGEAELAQVIGDSDYLHQMFPGVGQRAVADTMDTMSDPANPLRAKWHGSGPGAQPGQAGFQPSGYATNFAEWASAPSEDKAFSVGPNTVLNCWEMVMYAAYTAGQLNWKWIHDVYMSAPATWAADTARKLLPTTQTWFDRVRQLPIPNRGDLVLFNGIDHVALARGRGTETDTFWPPPDVAVQSGLAGGRRYVVATPDRVKRFNIEQLAAACDGPNPGSCTVSFGPPPWA